MEPQRCALNGMGMVCGMVMVCFKMELVECVKLGDDEFVGVL